MPEPQHGTQKAPFPPDLRQLLSGSPHGAEYILNAPSGVSAPVRRGPPEPLKGLLIVPLYALPAGVHVAEAVLRVSAPVRRGLKVPPHRLGVVLSLSAPVAVHLPPRIKLGVLVAEGRGL